MRVAALFGAFACIGLSSAANCDADNCLREVRGALTHAADCSAYLACAATASPVTITTTRYLTPSRATVIITGTPQTSVVSITVTPPAVSETSVLTETRVLETITVTPPITTSTSTVVQAGISPRKRNACRRRTSTLSQSLTTLVTLATSTASSLSCPVTTPSYASVCSGLERYSSACFCAGVTAVSATAAPSTVISTTTVTLSQLTRTRTASPSPVTVTSAVTLPAQTSVEVVTVDEPTLTVTVTALGNTSTVTVTAPPVNQFTD